MRLAQGLPASHHRRAALYAAETNHLLLTVIMPPQVLGSDYREALLTVMDPKTLEEITGPGAAERLAAEPGPWTTFPSRRAHAAPCTPDMLKHAGAATAATRVHATAATHIHATASAPSQHLRGTDSAAVPHAAHGGACAAHRVLCACGAEARCACGGGRRVVNLLASGGEAVQGC